MVHNAQLFAGVLAAATLAHAGGHGVTYDQQAYSGAVHFGQNIVGASVELTVPECKPGLPYDYYSTYKSDAWVGIDAYGGERNNTSGDYGLLQTGVTCSAEYDNNNTAEYGVWYEYYPYAVVFYNDSDIQAGDVLHMHVKAYSHTAGSTFIRNARTEKVYFHDFVDLDPPLIFGDAEWITESRLELTNVGPAGFLNAQYTPWEYKNMKYLTSDGVEHLFEYNTPGDHLVNTVLNNTQIATTTFNGPGYIQVNDTTPCDYFVADLFPQPRMPGQPYPNCVYNTTTNSTAN